MTEAWLWGLVASLIVLALGTTLAASRSTHGKKLAEDEASRLRAQLDAGNAQVRKPPPQDVGVEAAPAPLQHGGAENVHGQGEDILHKVLALVAELHSQNIPATPARVAETLGMDPGITLAHMWKYHNEQFITFANGGRQPDESTAFFLSPKAWQHIRIVRA